MLNVFRRVVVIGFTTLFFHCATPDTQAADNRYDLPIAGGRLHCEAKEITLQKAVGVLMAVGGVFFFNKAKCAAGKAKQKLKLT